MFSWTQVLVGGLALGAPAIAWGHPLGGPAVAWPLTPSGVGEVVDDGYRFSWSDTNFRTPTGTITIDWFYTRTMPPTFQLGVTPPDLEGTPIVLGIDEEDRTDAYTWDTRTVPAGSYWIWSHVTDLPGELSIRINAFSRGVVTVAHAGDAIYPAIAMVTPSSPFAVVDTDTYPVSYEAFDPDGTGVVTVEALRARDDPAPILIADGLPAAASATVTWTVADLAQGDWILRAHLVDGRGLTATAYGRFVVSIEHLDGGTGGPADSGARDGGSPDIGTYDGGVVVTAPSSGCGCASTEAPPLGAATVAAVLLLAMRRRRQHKRPR